MRRIYLFYMNIHRFDASAIHLATDNITGVAGNNTIKLISVPPALSRQLKWEGYLLIHFSHRQHHFCLN